MDGQNKENQERFSAETLKEGDVLKVYRSGSSDSYNIELTNQWGFKVADIPEGTEVILGAVTVMHGSIGHGAIKAIIEHRDGNIYLNDGAPSLKKFWDQDMLTITKLPQNNL